MIDTAQLAGAAVLDEAGHLGSVAGADRLADRPDQTVDFGCNPLRESMTSKSYLPFRSRSVGEARAEARIRARRTRNQCSGDPDPEMVTQRRSPGFGEPEHTRIASAAEPPPAEHVVEEGGSHGACEVLLTLGPVEACPYEWSATLSEMADIEPQTGELGHPDGCDLQMVAVGVDPSLRHDGVDRLEEVGDFYRRNAVVPMASGRFDDHQTGIDQFGEMLARR